MTKKQIGCLADKKTQAVEVEATNCTSTNHRTTENKRQKKSGEQLSVRTVLINSKQKHRNGIVLVLTKAKRSNSESEGRKEWLSRSSTRSTLASGDKDIHHPALFHQHPYQPLLLSHQHQVLFHLHYIYTKFFLIGSLLTLFHLPLTKNPILQTYSENSFLLKGLHSLLFKHLQAGIGLLPLLISASPGESKW